MKRLAHRVLFALVRISIALLRPLAAPGPRVRSLWVGDPVLVLATNARAERLNDVAADSLVFTTYFVTDAFDYDLSRWTRLPVLGKSVRYLALVWAAHRYQRFHFFYNRGLLPQLERGCFNPDELDLLFRLGKEIYFWAYGGDVRSQERTRSLGHWNCCSECPSPGSICVCEDDRADRNYQRVFSRATAVFSMGDMIHYTPGSQNELYYWPVPIDTAAGERYRPVFPDADAEAPLRIAHAPNQRRFKGTRFLEAAVESLAERGVEVVLEMVEGRPNDEVLELFRRADVVFDQCLIGFHGYTAHEAMALGKPVLCFLRHPELYLLAPTECPIVNVTPETLAGEIAALAADRPRLRRLGEAGRRYIEMYHTPKQFARRLGAALEQCSPAGGGRMKPLRVIPR